MHSSFSHHEFKELENYELKGMGEEFLFITRLVEDPRGTQ